MTESCTMQEWSPEDDASFAAALMDATIPMFYSNRHVLHMTTDDAVLLLHQGELVIAKVYMPAREAKRLATALAGLVCRAEDMLGTPFLTNAEITEQDETRQTQGAGSVASIEEDA